jgi:hypothetical protein
MKAQGWGSIIRFLCFCGFPRKEQLILKYNPFGMINFFLEKNHLQMILLETCLRG